MPLYEYHCRDCDADFEKLTRRDLADAVECPECGAHHSKRLLSMFATFSQTSEGAGRAMSGGGCACGGSCGCSRN